MVACYETFFFPLSWLVRVLLYRTYSLKQLYIYISLYHNCNCTTEFYFLCDHNILVTEILLKFTSKCLIHRAHKTLLGYPSVYFLVCKTPYIGAEFCNTFHVLFLTTTDKLPNQLRQSTDFDLKISCSDIGMKLLTSSPCIRTLCQ